MLFFRNCTNSNRSGWLFSVQNRLFSLISVTTCRHLHTPHLAIETNVRYPFACTHSSKSNWCRCGVILSTSSRICLTCVEHSLTSCKPSVSPLESKQRSSITCKSKSDEMNGIFLVWMSDLIFQIRQRQSRSQVMAPTHHINDCTQTHPFLIHFNVDVGMQQQHRFAI